MTRLTSTAPVRGSSLTSLDDPAPPDPTSTLVTTANADANPADLPPTDLVGDFASHANDPGRVGAPPRHPGVVARTGAGAQPVDPALYAAILDEARAADWQGCGIEPLRYVEDRLDRDRFLKPLRENPDARVVLHRRALRPGQVPGLDPRDLTSVRRVPARDWPGDVLHSARDDVFHVVNIPGEDWYLQTLHMLATAGVPADKILVEGAPDPRTLAAQDLDATLAAHDFDSVVIGTIGGVTRAVERALRQEAQPEHARRCLDAMGAFLDDKVASARPDKQPRWQDRAQRLRRIRDGGGSVEGQVQRIEADPDLASALAEQLRVLRDGAEVKDLPLRWDNCKAKVFSHRVLEVRGRKHLVIHIGGAHGDLAGAAVRRVLEREPGLQRVALYGSCGSFDGQRLPPDTFVRPAGSFTSLEHGRAPLHVDNQAHMDDVVDVAHGNVSTLLREHRAGLDALIAGADTVDIEGYHVAAAVAEAQASGRRVELRAILRVSDVASDSALGAHRDDRQGTSDYDGRREGEEEVVRALGLLDGANPAGGPP